MDGFITGIIFCIIGYYCGAKITKHVATLREERKDEHACVLERTIVISIEKEDGCVFAYNSKNGAFLAQGNSYETMLENFKARFPETIGLVFDPNSTSMREVSTITSKEWLRFDKKFKLSSVK